MLRNYTLTSFPIRDKDLDLVKGKAKALGISQAEVIRRAVAAFIGACPTCGRPFPLKRTGKKKGGK